MQGASMKLKPGTTVQVKLDWPETRGHCHIRTPHYLRGHTGVVVRHLGDYPNPEDLAFDRPAPVLPLYHVRFPLAGLWPDAKGDDTILVELYGSWLEAA